VPTKTVHCEQVTRQFMVVEQEAFAAMLVVRANAAQEAARVAAPEKATHVAEATTAAGGSSRGGVGG
jgi:hypothetical protein